MSFHVSSWVVSSSIYLLNATVETSVSVTKVHFSEVIFNRVDITNSKRYEVVYYEWSNDLNPAWRSLPS